MINLKVKDMDISTGGVHIAVVNRKDAEKLDLHTLDRLRVSRGRMYDTIVLDIAESEKTVPKGYIGLYEEVMKTIRVKNRDIVRVRQAGKPVSIDFIKKKLDGGKLTKQEIDQIVWDIVHNKLTNTELTYFVSACYARRMDMEETKYLTKAMAREGDILKFRRKPVVDKHCIGGVAGNRTTMVVVPIIAAAGLTIPKTSSRSITSAAGTADTMEVLADVELNLKKVKNVIRKTNGCMVWGGSINLAPADDKIIKVEKPLAIDAKSQLLASVMAKKASVSATHLVVDIPWGKGSKIESRQRALALKKDFEHIGKALGIKTKVLLTDGTQPIGNGIGPALEARDILWLLKNDSRAPLDLREKSVKLAGTMLELAGKAKKGKGVLLAREMLVSGKAYRKMIEIIKAQGPRHVEPDTIPLGDQTYEYRAPRQGRIRSISSTSLSKIARIAGAPEDKGSGLYLYKHVGDRVIPGEKIFTIYSHNKTELEFAKKALKRWDGIVIR